MSNNKLSNSHTNRNAVNTNGQQLSVEDTQITKKAGLSRRAFMHSSAGTLLMAGAASPLVISQASAESPGANSADCDTAQKPSAEEVLARYQRAREMEYAGSTKSVTRNTTVYPFWIEGSDRFWYVRETKTGKQYRLVDPQNASNTTAFDHAALARALSSASGEKVDADNLPLSSVEFSGTPLQISFDALDKRWRYHSQQRSCEQQVKYSNDWKISPDGKRAVFVRDYNLWVRDLKSGKERALTKDGERFNVYASMPAAYGRQETQAVDAIWSPDSKRILTHQMDTRKVKTGVPLVQHVPPDGSLRPVIYNPERRVAFPGDEHIDVYRFFSIDVGSGKIQRADYPESPVFWPPYAGFFIGERGWWDEDSQQAYFVELERGGLTARLLSFNTSTGAVRIIIEEKSAGHFDFMPSSHLHAMLLPLPGGKELVWFSERSGMPHLYLYDLKTGAYKNAITRGNWMVRNILHYDANNRELLIQTAGRVAGRNPYYCDICRVNIDSGQLKPLVSSDHEYLVVHPKSRPGFVAKYATGGMEVNSVSNSGRYLVTTRSRTDQVPVSLLLDRAGNTVLELETADVSGLPKGWQWPEPVMLKAADGITDIYGVVFRPRDFSPDRSYPVLDCTYSGMTPVGSFTNNDVGSWRYFAAAAYAELGFIVVMINARGTSLRGTAFKRAKDPLIGYCPNQRDCIAGIYQLAQRYPYMDLNRVGMGEGGSIASPLLGILGYPEFYKVSVSNNPAADSRLEAAYAEEAFYGKPQTPEEREKQLSNLAGNLKGKLLLMAGMMDDVLAVSGTFRVVEALQKANKNFDMLILPNEGHSMSKYPKKRAWDYLVEHLQGGEPPQDFDLREAP